MKVTFDLDMEEIAKEIDVVDLINKLQDTKQGKNKIDEIMEYLIDHFVSELCGKILDIKGDGYFYEYMGEN